MPFISNLVGAVMVGGGALKLTRQPAYERMVEPLRWSAEERQAIGAAELIGGALMLLGPTRRLGAAVVAAASGAALLVELRAEQTQLAGPRAGVLAAAILAAAAG